MNDDLTPQKLVAARVFPYPGFDPDEIHGTSKGRSELVEMYHPKPKVLRGMKKKTVNISCREMPYLYAPRPPFKRTHVLDDLAKCELAEILRAVSIASGVKRDDLRGPRRFTPITRARQVFFWLARRYTFYSLPDIGRYLDMDHTTVLHGVRRVEFDHNDYRELVEDAKSALAELLEAKQ
jgi:hypothetical protein